MDSYYQKGVLMKKILSLILAGIMAVTGCVLGYAPVEAAPVQGTSGDPADAGSAAYREGEALVLKGNIGSLQEPCEIGPGSRRRYQDN